MLFKNKNNMNSTACPMNEIKINNKIVDRVSEYKLLGIKIDDQLSMNKHHESIINHIKRYQGIFYKLRDKLSIKNK